MISHSPVLTPGDPRLVARDMAYQTDRVLKGLTGARLRRYIFISLATEAMPPSLPRAFEPLWCREDAPPVAALWPDLSVRAHRFEQGAECLVLRLAGEIVGGLWVTFSDFTEDEVRAQYRLSHGWGWDFGLFIPEQHRGGRVFAAIWAAVRARLEVEGRPGTLSRIGDSAAQSLKAHARLGARYGGSAVFLSWGTRQWCWSSQCIGGHRTQDTRDYALFDGQKMVSA